MKKGQWKHLTMVVGLMLALAGLSGLMVAQTAAKPLAPAANRLATRVNHAPRPAAPAANTFPHMKAALASLQIAAKQLSAASPIYYGQRHAALNHVNQAILAIKQGIATVQKQGPQKQKK